MATVDGTARLLRAAVDRGALHPRNLRPLLRGGVQPAPPLSVSAVGFGAYRVGGSDKEPSHMAAIRAALRSGVNLLDTSSHYADGGGNGATGSHGASERLIGRALREAAEQGDVQRDGVVLCTKVGHAKLGSPAPPGAVPLGPPGAPSDVFHSIHPEFVDSEVRASAERLGTAPDYVLLHNPEYFLTAQMHAGVPIADAWEEMYARLAQAFGALEALCEEGVIANGYGVSGNFLSCMFSTTGRGNLYEALALDRVVEAASAAAATRSSGSHRMRVAQLPINAVEGGAILGRGGAVPQAEEGDAVLADKLGVSVIGNRPLNALPLPGVSTGDWGRRGPTHWQLRDAKPMGAVESLLRRVLREACAREDLPLQQLALLTATSAQGVASSLCGMRTETYVADAAAVLAMEPLPFDAVERALTSVRVAAVELGCEKRGLW